MLRSNLGAARLRRSDTRASGGLARLARWPFALGGFGVGARLARVSSGALFESPNDTRNIEGLAVDRGLEGALQRVVVVTLEERVEVVDDAERTLRIAMCNLRQEALRGVAELKQMLSLLVGLRALPPDGGDLGGAMLGQGARGSPLRRRRCSASQRPATMRTRPW